MTGSRNGRGPAILARSNDGIVAAGSPEQRGPRGVSAATSLADVLYVLVAAALAVALSHVPALGVVLYPFKLFGTFTHEWSHALVTLLTGGHVVGLRINPDLSGEEYSAGGWGLAISSAGYLGTACAGAALLLAPVRRAKRTLQGIGATVAALPLAGMLLQGATFTLTTLAWAVVFAVVAVGVGRRGTVRLAGLFQQFLAVELCLTALDALRDLVWLALNAPGVATDATNAATATHVPAVVWAVLWSIAGCAVVGWAALHLARRALLSSASGATRLGRPLSS